jgi:hypothetical protein
MTAAPSMGATDQQGLAEEIYRLMVAQGSLFALDTPIRQSLTNLASFVARSQQRDEATVAAEIDAALSADSRFIRELVGDDVRFVTSRQGAYIARDETDTHSFKQRLHDPEHPLPIDDISVVVSTSRPAITTVEPVFISDYWQIQAGMPSAEEEAAEAAAAEAEAAEAEAAEAAETTELPAAEPIPVELEPVVVAEPVVAAEPELAPEPVAPEPEVVAEPAAAAEPEIAPEPVTPEPEIAPEPVIAPKAPAPEPAVTPAPRPARPAYERSTVFALADGTTIDLRHPNHELIAEHGEALRRALTEKIEQDPLRRIVSFGSRYFPEANVINLGKNDLRKIRDYILERGEPLLDSELIADVFYHNARQSDYEGWRFSLNYRLYREKDFEFVGVDGANLWSTKGLPAIGGKRVKAAEMGQITSYLVEGLDDSLVEQNAEAIAESGSVTLMLTFFSWEYGVLPLDAGLQALLPVPVLSEQRSAVLRFESPQHYTATLAEVRYPTGSRGGWVQGLEEFFHEHLVPGALITISRGAEPNLFTLSYEEAGETTERILTLDEKKNKLGFANLTYYAAVDADQLPSQARFGRLNRLKSFPMGERRKAEMILEHVAETMGEQVGSREAPRYAISLSEIFVAYNVLRPGSRALIEALLAQNSQFEADPDTPGLFFYTPAVGAADDEEEGEEEEETAEETLLDLQPTRRRYGGRYADDDE